MAEQNKTYVPKSSAKEIVFQDGGSILKLSFHAATVAKFLTDNANEKGYVNFGVSKRKVVGQFGDTHCIWLDTWKPQPKQQQPATDTTDAPPF